MNDGGEECLYISPGSGGAAMSAALMRIVALKWQPVPRDIGSPAESASDFGAFTGVPARVAQLADGRRVLLLAPLTFVSSDGSKWPVPADGELDGASIPWIFWSLIGGPLEGRYCDASIIHDHYCGVRSRPWRPTHRMFYEAMRCSGESAARAKIMYYAVYRFGSRWKDAEGFAASIRYAIARLNVDSKITSILFFKITDANADFESATTTMTANNSSMAVTEGSSTPPRPDDKDAYLSADIGDGS